MNDETFVENDFEYAVEGGYAVLSHYRGKGKVLNIPETLGGYSITSIGKGAFFCCRSLTKVTIPNSLTSIGKSAFSGCCSLTEVTIPDLVTNIGDSAFWCCRDLTKVTIPDLVTNIGDGTFCACMRLREVIIPNSVTSIGCNAFQYCVNVTEVSIPDSVTNIGESAFSDCISLHLVVSKNNSVYKVIDGVLFDKTKNILHTYFNTSSSSSYTIPDSITSIGNCAFHACSSLTEVTIPNSVTSIGERAFWGCSSLTAITIPDSVTSIVESTFYRCRSLTKVIIPDSVTSIGNGAFHNCSRLIKMTIPDSVTSIEDNAFQYCTNLTTIFYQNKELKTKCIDGDCMVVKKVHEIDGFSILNCLYFGTNNKCFVAERNGISAHGETIKQAIDDLLFKQLQSEDYQLHIDRIKEKETMNSNDYRLLTGACQMGVDNFIREKNLENDATKEYPIREVLKLTTGFWGSEKLIDLLRENNV